LPPYLFFLLDCLWERALPAADFDFLLVLPSRRTLDAALAALFEVTLFGALVWDRALPEAVFDLVPVFLLRRVLEALLAALGRVTLNLAILSFSIFLRVEEGATEIVVFNATEAYLLLHSLHCSFEGRELVLFQPGAG